MTAPLISVGLKILAHGEGLPLPAYQSAGAAGCDLAAALEAPLVIAPGARAKVPTGLAIELPDHYEAQVRSRSGLALKDGIAVLNAPGTIDADYRGEIFVILVNHGHAPVEILRGARIAQLVLAPIVRASFVATSQLGDTMRGAEGFGSTGVGEPLNNVSQENNVSKESAS